MSSSAEEDVSGCPPNTKEVFDLHNAQFSIEGDHLFVTNTSTSQPPDPQLAEGGSSDDIEVGRCKGGANNDPDLNVSGFKF